MYRITQGEAYPSWRKAGNVEIGVLQNVKNVLECEGALK